MSNPRFEALIGVGGIGTGIFFALEGNHDIGRNETRLGRLLDYRDACKLHIISHMAKTLSGSRPFHVVPVGRVGNDGPGEELLRQMNRAGLDIRWVRKTEKAPTLFAVCFQFPDGAGGNLTPNNSACSTLMPDDLEECEPLLSRYGKRAMVLAAPEVSLATRASLLERGTRHGCYRIASFVRGEIPEAQRMGLFGQVDLLAFNEEEAAVWADYEGTPRWGDSFRSALQHRLDEAAQDMRLVVTLGAEGAVGYEGGRWVHLPIVEAPVVSTAGAGDTFLGAVLAWLSAGGFFLPPTDREEKFICSALEFGNLAAAFSVTRPDTLVEDLNWETLGTFASARGLHLAQECLREPSEGVKTCGND